LKGKQVSKIKRNNEIGNLYLITSNGYVTTPYSWPWYTSIRPTAGGPDPLSIQIFSLFYFLVIFILNKWPGHNKG
jgi:hypothetical protein